MSDKRPDITPVEPSNLPWETANCVDSIQRLADLARGEANKAIKWYVDAKRAKKRGAMWTASAKWARASS